MAANNEIGTVAPVPEIDEVCPKAGALFHSDAAQFDGTLSLDVCAAYVASLFAHKMYGPKGIGALYLRRGTSIDTIFYGYLWRWPRVLSAERQAQRTGHRSGSVPRLLSRARLRTSWFRQRDTERFEKWYTHSGCARYSSLSGLTTSGSTQFPNPIPNSWTRSITGLSPEGNFLVSTVQSPRPARSLSRPENQPSSMTKSSTPISGTK